MQAELSGLFHRAYLGLPHHSQCGQYVSEWKLGKKIDEFKKLKNMKVYKAEVPVYSYKNESE